MTRSTRKDIAALHERGEISETAAASIVGVTAATLRKWRNADFAGHGAKPAWRQIHPRLVAYGLAGVQELARHLAARYATA